MKMISCVIPAYNEEKNIDDTLKSIINTKICDEIVIVDDGSRDKTYEIIKNFIKKYDNIKIIKNYRNVGKTKSVLRGLKYSQGEIIVIIDADLKGLNKENLEKLIDPVKNNEQDITIASGIPFVWKRYSGLRCFKKEIFKIINQEKINYNYYNLEEIINKIIKKYQLKFKYIKISGVRNPHKIKKYGLIKGLNLSLKMYFEIIKEIFKKN